MSDAVFALELQKRLYAALEEDISEPLPSWQLARGAGREKNKPKLYPVLTPGLIPNSDPQGYTKLMDFMEDLACQVKGIHVYEAKCSGFYLNYQIMVRYGLGPLQLYDQLEKKAQNFELGHQTKEAEAQKNWIAYTSQV